jgi:superfamily II DNA or RNA helicase
MTDESPRIFTRQQTELIDLIVDARSPVRLLLVAPTGYGKSVAAAEAAARLIGADNEASVLYFAPTPLHLQTASLLATRDCQPALLTKALIRRMVERGQDALARGNPVILPLSLLAQRDVVNWLTRTRWRLVVVDEAHTLSQAQQEGLLQLGKSAQEAHLLLVTATPADGDPLPGVRQISWTRDLELMARERQTLSAGYRPTTAEDETAELLGRLRDKLDAMESALPGLASSSVIGLETTVSRLLTHEAGALPDNAHDDLTDLARSLVALSEDAKLAACIRLVRQIRSTGKSVIVFTGHGDTARYVFDALAEEMEDVQLTTGVSEPGGRPQDATFFAEHGGVAVVTDPTTASWDVARPDAVGVAYDLPDQPAVWSQRWRHLDRVGRVDVPQMHVLLAEPPQESELERLRLLGISLSDTKNPG